MTSRISVSIEINEAELERQSGEIFRGFHRSLTRRIANQARVAVPVRTGNLGRSIGEMTQTYVPFHVGGGVEATADYAAPVHEGSRPHTIRARNAQFLRFMWHGQEVFRKSVWHPGAKARPFLRLSGERVAAEDEHIS